MKLGSVEFYRAVIRGELTPEEAARLHDEVERQVAQNELYAAVTVVALLSLLAVAVVWGG